MAREEPLMTSSDLFESQARSSGDRAGVFEYDGETSYFYLHDLRPSRILGYIHILTGLPDFDGADLSILWNKSEDVVGLFIRGQLWAFFDGERPFGGGYHPGREPMTPPSGELGFELDSERRTPEPRNQLTIGTARTRTTDS